MNISIIGTGYVGLVHGAIMSYFGNDVTCIDINEEKIRRLKNIDIPIYEPGLEDIVRHNYYRDRLHFSTNYESVKESDLVFIAVGTPSREDGSANLDYVFSAANSIAQNTGKKDIIIVTKSTVPVGTTYKIKEIVLSYNHKCKIGFASNPEFLKEGSAVDDSLMPDRIVVGSDEKWVADKMYNLYKQINSNIIYTDILSSEMIKYASNSMLATRISFMNEIANLCNKIGANVKDVELGVGCDRRIGKKFLKPGCGYGGSCFPKDVKELIVTGEKNGVNMSIIKAVDNANNKQKEIPVIYLKEMLNDLKDTKICVLGAAFKPNTDDIREASSITIVNRLLENGSHVHIYDPIANENMREIFGDKIYYFDDPYKAISECDAAIVVTEWKEIVSMDWKLAYDLMSGYEIVDGRNCLDKNEMEKIGFIYKSI